LVFLKGEVNLSEIAIGKRRVFENKELALLFLPLIFEQFLGFLVGMSDSIMVSFAGESAVSGVSLVDFLMAVLISIFAALATGGSVIAGQYLGKKQEKEARSSANQLVWFTGTFASVIMAALYVFRVPIIGGLFGSITPEVYDSAMTYLMIVGASIPFLAVYSSAAGIFRTTGNSRLPMNIMLSMNLVNVVGNAIMVYGLGLGTVGVAVPTLISRVGAAVIIVFYATGKDFILRMERTLRHRFDKDMIRRILSIGVPYGLENGIFFFGRLIILSLVSTFGTAAIAANAVSGTIVMFQVLPGIAIGLGMTAVISRCIGSGDYESAKYYTRKIIAMIYIAHVLSTIAVLTILPAVLRIYSLSPEATLLTTKIVWSHGIMMMLIWPLAYTFPVVFRASGDARFPMTISILAMFLCRIALAYILAVNFNMGLYGTWIAMFIDWIVKSLFFIYRYLNGKWMRFRTI
jgi:putative MATE family efflux protein